MPGAGCVCGAAARCAQGANCGGSSGSTGLPDGRYGPRAHVQSKVARKLVCGARNQGSGDSIS